jgi:NAD-dependent DNA ligase
MELVKKINKNPFEEVQKLTNEQLEEVIKLANDKYRNTNKPIMEDSVYDILVDWLEHSNPKSKVLKEIGAKVKLKNKVALDYWLGSMDKIKSHHIKELEKWLKTYKGPYFLSDKLDGISALVIYRSNNIINLYTRGTADEGLDITPLIKYLNLPSWGQVSEHVLKKSSKKDIIISLRGELIMKKKVFDKNWSSTMKNGRNSVAGLVNSKTINPKLANDTSFVIYEIVDPFIPFVEQMTIAEDLGFEIVKYKTSNTVDFNILSQYFKERRDKSDYLVDGIIVTNNEQHLRNTKSNPEYAFAFKDILEDQKASSTVKEIEWNVSKDGYMKPTIIIEAVQIGGVEINRVTGFNAKFIVDNVLGVGAKIDLIRSGDVIPHIQRITKPASKPDLPKNKWHWNETKVDIIADDLETDDIVVKNIYYFFSKLSAKGLGEKIVEKLVNAGHNTIKKIIELDVDTIKDIDGFKEKSAQNLVDSIKKSIVDIPLYRLMSASNKLGHGIGEERMKLILDKYPDILSDYKKWSKEEFINNLKELNGFEEKISSLIVNNFNEFIKFYNSIKTLITIEKVIEKKIIKSKYTDLTIVISGFRDSELESKLESMGAKIGSTVSSKTDLVIIKDLTTEPTSKVLKAQELGIKIITRNQVF